VFKLDLLGRMRNYADYNDLNTILKNYGLKSFSIYFPEKPKVYISLVLEQKIIFLFLTLSPMS